MKQNAFRDNLGMVHEINDNCCGTPSKFEEVKEGRPIPNSPVIKFTNFMDMACRITKKSLNDFFSLAAKLTDFDTDCNQGWLYTEENMALYEKNMAYFSIDERVSYPIGDIEILINTYGCINGLADYLYNCFVTSNSKSDEERDCQKSSAYFSDRFDELYSILCCIRAKFIAIITAFQPDNEYAKKVIEMDKPFDPGYMSYMDHLLVDMTNINFLIYTLITDIFGFENFETVKEDVKND